MTTSPVHTVKEVFETGDLDDLGIRIVISIIKEFQEKL